MQSCKLFGTSRLAGGFLSIQEKAALDAQPGFSFADLIEVRANKGIECPHCGNVEFVKNGTRKGVQRYKCKDCNTVFNDLSNSFLSCTHKDFDTWKA